MNVSLTEEMKDFVQKKVENGQYPSKEAVIEAALKRLRDQEDEGRRNVPTLDDLIDREFVEFCTREADDSLSLEEVLEGTRTIKDSMARVIIEEERADRF
jgi:putative addiction module CopG family antidote